MSLVEAVALQCLEKLMALEMLLPVAQAFVLPLLAVWAKSLVSLMCPATVLVV
jgi:hypothetical protein